MNDCLDLLVAIKDRWDASSAFKDEKGRITSYIASFNSVVDNAQRFSVSFPAEIETLTECLSDLDSLIMFCDKHPCWTTWVRPNKYRDDLLVLLKNIDQHIQILNLQLQLQINQTTTETSDDVKTMKEQLKTLMAIFGKEVDTNKISIIDSEKNIDNFDNKTKDEVAVDIFNKILKNYK